MDPRKCKEVSATRDGLKEAALWAVNSKKTIHYTQEYQRWSGIRNQVCPKVDVPPHADCSSFVTWLYWSAFGSGPDYLNDANWTGGYTGRMADHGKKISLSEAQPGDLVLYGTAKKLAHVAMYVGNNEVVSFGQTGPAHLLDVHYRNDFIQVRSYPKFFGES
ncbi:4719_t:CDS:1, partial [Acaulospora morrowiae]